VNRGTNTRGFEVARARITNYGGSYDAVLVHRPLSKDLTAGVKDGLGNRTDLIITNDESDCTEITFNDGSKQKPIPPDILAGRVAGILTGAGHKVDIMKGLVEVNVLDPAPERVYERFHEAA
jgi:hypothetical protein